MSNGNKFIVYGLNSDEVLGYVTFDMELTVPYEYRITTVCVNAAGEEIKSYGLYEKRWVYKGVNKLQREW